MLKTRRRDDKLLKPAASGHRHRRAPPHAADPVERADRAAGGKLRRSSPPTSRCRSPRRADARRQRRGPSTTVGARKLYDILRSLPEDADVSLDAKDSRMTVKAGKSALQPADAGRRRTFRAWPRHARQLQTLHAAAEGPEARCSGWSQFAMAHAGHPLLPERRAVRRSTRTRCRRSPPTAIGCRSRAARSSGDHGASEVILPRKTVLELIKLLADADEPVALAIGSPTRCASRFGSIEIVSQDRRGQVPRLPDA